MTTDLLGFLDESKKPVRDPRTGRVSTSGEFYVVAAAVVLSGDIEAIRAELREAVARLGFPFHYADLRSKSRRVDALDAVLSIEGWDAYVFETARPMSPRNNSEHQMRAKALSAAFTVLSAEEGVSEFVLETRGHPIKQLDQLDQKDHQVLQRLTGTQKVPAGLQLRHADKGEPILQLPDLIASARTGHLCSVDREMYARLSHRVRRITPVLGKDGS